MEIVVLWNSTNLCMWTLHQVLLRILITRIVSLMSLSYLSSHFSFSKDKHSWQRRNSWATTSSFTLSEKFYLTERAFACVTGVLALSKLSLEFHVYQFSHEYQMCKSILCLAVDTFEVAKSHYVFVLILRFTIYWWVVLSAWNVWMMEFIFFSNS